MRWCCIDRLSRQWILEGTALQFVDCCEIANALNEDMISTVKSAWRLESCALPSG